MCRAYVRAASSAVAKRLPRRGRYKISIKAARGTRELRAWRARTRVPKVLTSAKGQVVLAVFVEDDMREARLRDTAHERQPFGRRRRQRLLHRHMHTSGCLRLRLLLANGRNVGQRGLCPRCKVSVRLAMSEQLERATLAAVVDLDVLEASAGECKTDL